MRREYPSQPLIGIGGVIIQDDKILLAKRASEPGKGKWSIPGGLVELGEKIEKTVVREVKEETNLDVEVVHLIDAVNNIVYDANGKLRFHFVILDFLTELKGGTLQPSSDVLDTKWIRIDEAEDYDLTLTFREFLKRNKEALKKPITKP